MQKTTMFALIGVVLVLALTSQVSASIFENPTYHTYVLGYGNVDAGYTSSSSSTYEKTSSSADTPWGSQDHVLITKTSTDSFQPNQPVYNNYADSGFQNTNVWYAAHPNGNSNDNYNHYHQDYNNLDNGYNSGYGCSSFSCQPAYNPDNYGNYQYGQPYYYQPIYDWHAQVFNWAY